MRKFFVVILLFFLLIYLSGCGKKKNASEQLQEPMSIEDLSKLKSQEDTGNLPQDIEEAPQSEIIKNLPPAGPYKPTVQEIQKALKNAGLYYANIDGKIGPITKQAIEEFQKKNGLKVDGKVGPKTWAVLDKYLHTGNKSSTTSSNKKN